MRTSKVAPLLTLALVLGCSPTGEPHDDDHEETEIISRVELSFTPTAGGDTLVAAFSDPDGDGGVSGSADPIVLTLGTEYTLRVAFLNELTDPITDITGEVEDEAEEHLVFVVGDGVVGPASSSSTVLVSHTYADLESDYGPNATGDDLPVGLVNTISADQAGSGTLRVMLRHLPPLNGAPQKTAELPQSLAAGDALPGEVDVDLSFDLTIQ